VPRQLHDHLSELPEILPIANIAARRIV
jgi:hypothetical protein